MPAVGWTMSTYPDEKVDPRSIEMAMKRLVHLRRPPLPPHVTVPPPDMVTWARW